MNWEDRRGTDTPVVDGAVECAYALALERIRVRIIGELTVPGISGWGCPTGLVLLEAGQPEALRGLAHEVGHPFGLRHVDFGLMQPGGAGEMLSDGQVWRSHVEDLSALNTLFEATPAPLRRPCITVGGCLGAAFDLAADGGGRVRPVAR